MEILTTVLKNKAINTEPDIDYDSITSKMDGYVSLDIVQVVDRATHLAVSQSGINVFFSSSFELLEINVNEIVCIIQGQ